VRANFKKFASGAVEATPVHRIGVPSLGFFPHFLDPLEADRGFKNMQLELSRIVATALVAAVTLSDAAVAEPVSLEAFKGLERPRPSQELLYGSAPAQGIDIFLPAGKGPHPVVILLPGGCWTIRTAGREQLRHLGADLAKDGIAVWTIGYRRADEPGGGYPGTYQDVATAIDLLRGEAARFALDLGKVVLVGHSAGGHLALWAAARRGLRPDGPLASAEPFIPPTIVSLAGIGDLKTFGPQVPQICGPGILESLTTRSENGARRMVLDEVSPVEMQAPDAKIVMVSGILDRLVPPYVANDYAVALAKKAGKSIERVDIPDAGHFDLVTTGTPAWTIVRARILDALGMPRSEQPH
jgi:acetyl esterase/lipase